MITPIDVSLINLDFSPNVITTRILVQVAIEMTKFEFVAQYLGFDKNNICRLQEDYNTRDERCYQMLREWWENSTKESPTTLEELHRGLCLTDQGNCIPGILKRNDDYKNIEYLSDITKLTEKMLNSTIITINGDTTVLSDVAAELTRKCTWCHVGRLVGLEDNEIDEIENNYDKCRERAYQMLRKWLEKYGSSAKLSQLAVALLIVRQPHTITYLKRL